MTGRCWSDSPGLGIPTSGCGDTQISMGSFNEIVSRMKEVGNPSEFVHDEQNDLRLPIVHFYRLRLQDSLCPKRYHLLDGDAMLFELSLSMVLGLLASVRICRDNHHPQPTKRLSKKDSLCKVALYPPRTLFGSLPAKELSSTAGPASSRAPSWYALSLSTSAERLVSKVAGSSSSSTSNSTRV